MKRGGKIVGFIWESGGISTGKMWDFMGKPVQGVEFSRANDPNSFPLKRKLESLEELESEADLVVNCCGLGAVHLVSSSKTLSP